MERVDCVVIGAGVVGLAVARALALAGREVVILEQEAAIGLHTSSRNSEVIHAGIYYPTGSLKARLCVAGRERLYAHCQAHGVPHRRLGKLIVASAEDQRAMLEGLARTAAANGVDDLRWLDAAELRRVEPELKGVAALLSPSTGILDSHAFMQSLEGEAQANGALLVLQTEVHAIDPQRDGLAVWCGAEAGPQLLARSVVNAAGLRAAVLAQHAARTPSAVGVAAHYAKGSYFTLCGRAPFSRLVYPAPEPGGLGVHMTLDLAGQARFGPDVQWVDAIDYTVDPSRAAQVYEAVRRYWPGLRDGALSPGYAGVRPKLHGPGEPAADFRIETEEHHGAAGLINLLGIESPGLTASLALADEVCALTSR